MKIPKWILTAWRKFSNPTPTEKRPALDSKDLATVESLGERFMDHAGGRYPGDRIEVVRQESTETLARAFVLAEFKRLLDQVSQVEYVKVDIGSVARPDASSTEHRWKWDWPGKHGREWQEVSLRISHEGMLRVIAGVDINDPVFLTIVAHRTTPININISSLLYARADDPVSVWVFSSQPFSVDSVSAKLRLAPEIIAEFRETHMKEHGWVGSIPAQDSAYGRQFYEQHPEYLP